jgi:hypothetical protein
VASHFHSCEEAGGVACFIATAYGSEYR